MIMQPDRALSASYTLHHGGHQRPVTCARKFVTSDSVDLGRFALAQCPADLAYGRSQAKNCLPKPCMLLISREACCGVYLRLQKSWSFCGLFLLDPQRLAFGKLFLPRAVQEAPDLPSFATCLPLVYDRNMKEFSQQLACLA